MGGQKYGEGGQAETQGLGPVEAALAQVGQGAGEGRGAHDEKGEAGGLFGGDAQGIDQDGHGEDGAPAAHKTQGESDKQGQQVSDPFHAGEGLRL